MVPRLFWGLGFVVVMAVASVLCINVAVAVVMVVIASNVLLHTIQGMSL